MRRGHGPTDDTEELRRRLGHQGANITLDAGRTYRIRRLNIAAGVTLTIPETCVVEVEDNGFSASNSLLIQNADDVTISGGGTIRGTSSARTANYGLIRAENSDRLTVAEVVLHTSPSNGLWVLGGDSLDVTDVEVHTTGADGIQVTRGATNFVVLRPNIHDTGDDAIGVNSYTADGATSYDPVTGGTISHGTIARVTTGRGVAINGGQQIDVHDMTIDDTDQSAILVSRVTDQTHDPADVDVYDNTLTDYGLNPPGGGTSASVYFAHCTGGSSVRNSGNADRVVEASCSNITTD